MIKWICSHPVPALDICYMTVNNQSTNIVVDNIFESLFIQVLQSITTIKESSQNELIIVNNIWHIIQTIKLYVTLLFILCKLIESYSQIIKFVCLCLFHWFITCFFLEMHVFSFDGLILKSKWSSVRIFIAAMLSACVLYNQFIFEMLET